MTVRFTTVSPQSAGTIELSCELTDSQGWTAIQVPAHYSLRGALSATGRERFGCSKDLHFLPEWPDEGITLTATSSRLVRGRLQFPDGESKTKVTVWRDIGGPVAPKVSDVWVDSTGRFVAAADTPGPGVLAIEGEGLSPLLVRFETVAGKRVTEIGEIVLSKGRRLSGSVVSRSGRPLSSVLVRARLEPPWSKYFPVSRWTARTGDDGTFELKDPPIEPMVIEARHPAKAGHATTVTAIPGEEPVKIVIPVE
jgi:hypothetical protein